MIHVVFAGTPDFAVPSLQALINHPDISVDLVITQPDRPVGRKKVITAPPVKLIAEKNEIEVIQPEKLNSWFKENKPDVSPDFLVVVAYGQIVSQAVLDWPKQMAVNVHGSLLPKWRGASPIQCSIAAGDTETGVTIQQMVYKMDAGDILATTKTPITSTTTSPDLFENLSKDGAEALVNVLLDPPEPQPQNEDDATYCKKLSRADGELDHSEMTAENIDRHVRAFTPWPGVTLNINLQRVCVESLYLFHTIIMFDPLSDLSDSPAVTEAPAAPQGGGGNRQYAQDLHSVTIHAEHRTFYVDLKESSKGKFFKMTEKSRGGKKSTIMFDSEDLPKMIEALEEMKAHV